MPTEGAHIISMNVLNLKTDTSISKGDIKSYEETQPLHNSKSSPVKKIKCWCTEQYCSVKGLKRRLPILVWLPKYSFTDFKGDLVAGLTVALTVIPQGLALALLAHLPPQFGLYTAFMGCFMYVIFGSCKNLTIGPTAIMSLMTAEYVNTGGTVYCILITFLTGCIQLLMGILNLGVLVTFISSAVVSGFTSAAAITIAISQLSGLFGLKYPSDGFVSDISNFFYGISHGKIRYWDMTMGLCCIVFLLVLKHCSDIKFVSCFPNRIAKHLESLWWTISTAKNALLVLISTGIAALLISNGLNVLSLTPEVKPGLPEFKVPEFTYSHFNNATNQTIVKDFGHILQDMGAGLIIMPLLCILESIAIAKSFAKGQKIDATQEMIALGVCNIMGSFVSAYPATGSFTRTAVNYNSGVRTTAGGIVTGGLVLLALGVMSPYFRFIPKAALSALIIVAVLNMVHYKDIVVMWRTNKMDLLPFFATFIASFLLGLEYGILIGIVLSLCMLLFQEARPKIIVEEKKTFMGNPYVYIKPDRTVMFPSAEYLQCKIMKSVGESTESYVYAVIFDGEHLVNADYTMAVGVKNIINGFQKENISVIFYNLKENVRSCIQGASPVEFIIFETKEDAENYVDALGIQNNCPPAYVASISEGDDSSTGGLT